MAIDFEVEPEFQEKLDWIDEFVKTEVEPLDLYFRGEVSPFDKTHELAQSLVKSISTQTIYKPKARKSRKNRSNRTCRSVSPRKPRRITPVRRADTTTKALSCGSMTLTNSSSNSVGVLRTRLCRG